MNGRDTPCTKGLLNTEIEIGCINTEVSHRRRMRQTIKKASSYTQYARELAQRLYISANRELAAIEPSLYPDLAKPRATNSDRCRAIA